MEVQFHEFDFRCCWLIGILPLIREIPTPILGHGWKFYGSTPSHFTRPAELPIPTCLLMFPSSRLSSLFTRMLIDKILGLLDIGQKNGRETQQHEETGKCQVSSSTKTLGSIQVASVSMRLALSFSCRVIYTPCVWLDVVWATVWMQWEREIVCPGQHRLEWLCEQQCKIDVRAHVLSIIRLIGSARGRHILSIGTCIINIFYFYA